MNFYKNFIRWFPSSPSIPSPTLHLPTGLPAARQRLMDVQRTTIVRLMAEKKSVISRTSVVHRLEGETKANGLIVLALQLRGHHGVHGTSFALFLFLFLCFSQLYPPCGNVEHPGHLAQSRRQRLPLGDDVDVDGGLHDVGGFWGGDRVLFLGDGAVHHRTVAAVAAVTLSSIGLRTRVELGITPLPRFQRPSAFHLKPTHYKKKPHFACYFFVIFATNYYRGQQQRHPTGIQP